MDTSVVIKMRIKKAVISLLVAAAAVAAAGYFILSSREPQLRFITAEAQRGELRSVIIATGTVQPVSMVNVGTQISGTIKSLYFDYNSAVKKGQLIALIDPATQEAQVRQSLAALEALRADALDAEATRVLALRNAKRSRELYEGDLIALSDLDATEAALSSAAARLSAAKAKILQQEASLEQARLQLSYTRIYSPVDGVIVTKSVEEGQTVAASYNTPTIAEIAEDLSQMQVEVKVDEADIGNVRTGQTAEFYVDAFPERRFSGEVEQIRLSPTTENNVTSYIAIVKFRNEQRKGQNLIPGMTANVTLVVSEREDVVTVPNAALRFRPLDPSAVPDVQEQTPGSRRRGGTGNARRADTPPPSTVYRLEKGKPVKIEVTRGITDGVNTEIVSGLEPGAEIITGIEAPSDN